MLNAKLLFAILHHFILEFFEKKVMLSNVTFFNSMNMLYDLLYIGITFSGIHREEVMWDGRMVI
jgi:hypothetical protein